MSRFLFAFLVVTSSLPALAEMKVAVLPVTPKNGISAEEADLLTDLVTAEVGKRKDLKVIGAAELRTLVTLEQAKSVFGCTDDSCLAEVGAALGVDAVVSGSVGKLGGMVLLNLLLMDARKSQVIGRHTEQVADTRELVKVVPFAAATLMQGIPGGPPPPARPTMDNASAPSSSGSQQGAATVAADEGGSSATPRRIGGLAVAGVGGALLLSALAVGAVSVGWLLAGRFAVPVLTTGPVKYVGMGIAGVADLVGITAIILVGAGIVIAAIP